MELTPRLLVPHLCYLEVTKIKFTDFSMNFAQIPPFVLLLEGVLLICLIKLLWLLRIQEYLNKSGCIFLSNRNSGKSYSIN